MSERGDSLKTLSRIAQILEKSQPSENPLSHITSMVKEQMKADVCSLYILEGKTLTLVATEGLKSTAIGKVKMGIHEGLTGLAVEKLQPVIVNEASKHPRFKYFPETGEEKFNSFAAVPLMERGQVVGVLTIQTIDSRQFDQQEIELLKLIAFQLAGVIHNLVVLESVQNNPLEKRTRHFTGVPVAPGFGIGPAFFLHHALGTGADAVIVSPNQMKAPGDFDPKLEWKKMEEALQKTQDDLEKLEKRLEKKFSKSESDIFSSHRMILSDKSFLKKIKSVVQAGHTAAASIHLVVNEYIGEFQKIPDAYLRERATDLEDILQRVLENLSHGSAGKKKKGRKDTQNSHDQWEGVLIADNLMPSDTVKLDPERITGIITLRGGSTSHAAILARSMGIPAVMGVEDVFQKIKAGDLVVVDGNVGHIYVNPDKPILQEYEKIQSQHADKIIHLKDLSHQPAITKDGRRITLEANVGLFSGLKNIRDFGPEGIGLYRTEFPFMTRKKLPTVEEQVEIYVRVLKGAEDIPVTFRLFGCRW
ncbi:MAG: GAF domain-containing protein [Deltaproteobacteria bacterium]|nr:MAG: GAF domain-containing protein [Deltaproteobacteria bacterium]